MYIEGSQLSSDPQATPFSPKLELKAIRYILEFRQAAGGAILEATVVASAARLLGYVC
jgi:hypothetical protein